jgi:hypothetical protein
MHFALINNYIQDKRKTHIDLDKTNSHQEYNHQVEIFNPFIE